MLISTATPMSRQYADLQLREARVAPGVCVEGDGEADAVCAAWIARLVQQPLGALRVIAVVALQLGRPLLERRVIRSRGYADHALRLPIRAPVEVVVVHGLEVEGHLHRVAHPDVVERLHGDRHADARFGAELPLVVLQLGIAGLQALDVVDRGDIRGAGPVEKVDLAGTDGRDAGSRLPHHYGLDAVDVGQPVLRELLVEVPVVVDPFPGEGAALYPVDQLEWSGADVDAIVQHVTVLFDHLRRVDVRVSYGADGDVAQRLEDWAGELEHHGLGPAIDVRSGALRAARALPIMQTPTARRTSGPASQRHAGRWSAEHRM